MKRKFIIILLVTVLILMLLLTFTACDENNANCPSYYYQKLYDKYWINSDGMIASKSDGVNYMSFYAYTGTLSTAERMAVIEFYFDENSAKEKYSEIKDDYSRDGLKIVLRDNVLIYGDEQIVNDAI